MSQRLRLPRDGYAAENQRQGRDADGIFKVSFVSFRFGDQQS
jgi:hypothetical protein